jgi:hypothetical protein
MKINIVIKGLCIGCVFLIALGFQHKEKLKSQDQRISRSHLAVSDTILPDTTLAKIDTLKMKERELLQIIDNSKIKLYSERIETNLMSRNSATLQNIVEQQDDSMRPKPFQVATNVVKYPDTLTIVIKAERRGLFKRKR